MASKMAEADEVSKKAAHDIRTLFSDYFELFRIMSALFWYVCLVDYHLSIVVSELIGQKLYSLNGIKLDI